MNRSTIYEFLRNDSPLEMRFTKIGKGSYPVLRVPYDWDTSFLIINNTRFTDFQAIILFSNELVVRFMIYSDCQVNVPYRDIEKLEIYSGEDMEVGYGALHDKDKVRR